MQISWVPLPQGVLQGSNPGISQSCGLISRLHWGRIQFLAGCWLEASLSSLLPCGPFHRTAFNMAACFPQSKSKREGREGGREGKLR